MQLFFSNRSKAPDEKPPGQKPPYNKLPRIIAKYAVDANLFRQGSTNPKKNPAPGYFWAFIPGAYCWGAFVRVAFVRGLLT